MKYEIILQYSFSVKTSFTLIFHQNKKFNFVNAQSKSHWFKVFFSIELLSMSIKKLPFLLEHIKTRYRYLIKRIPIYKP